MNVTDFLDRPRNLAADGRRWYEQTRRPSEGLSVPDDCRDLAMASTWPTLVVDALCEEVRVAGVRGDDAATDWFKVNSAGSTVFRAVRDCLIDGVSFLASDGSGAVRCWRADDMVADIDAIGCVTAWAYHYVVDGVERAVACVDGGEAAVYERSGDEWHRVCRAGGFTVRALVNPLASSWPYAESVIAPVMSLCDRAERVAAELQVAVELQALPVRMLSGDGSARTVIQNMPSVRDLAGEVLAGPAGAQLSELRGGSIEPMLATLRYYALQVSALTGVPPHMFGVVQDANPTSADALLVAQDRLAGRARVVREGVQVAVEDVFSAAYGGVVEVAWATDQHVRDSQFLASVLAANAQGAVSREVVWEALGLSPAQVVREREAGDAVSVVEVAE